MRGRLRRYLARRRDRRVWAERDARHGWYEAVGGNWCRVTPHGDLTDQLLDRFAEDYVEHGWTVKRLEEQIELAFERTRRFDVDIEHAFLHGSPFQMPQMEAVRKL